MFVNQSRKSIGMGTLWAVALVLAGWAISTGVLMQEYQKGGLSTLPPNTRCEAVCPETPVKVKG
jgi:hypothetical protein